MPSYHYFSTTRKTVDVITQTFNFLKPTAVALWNMRLQYKGYMLENPTATQPEIDHRFVEGCNIKGANIRASCAEKSWEDQVEMFSQILLIQLCAIFESWIEEILKVLRENDEEKRSAIAKKLQYPNEYHDGLKQLISSKSKVLAVFYDGLKEHKKNNSSHIKELLVCYRYFKECRNSLVHSGGISGTRLIECETKLLQVAPADLKLKRIPDIIKTELGKRVRLNFKGIEIFADIVIQLITTYDAELSQCNNAEAEFLELWGNAYGEKKLNKHDNSKRIKQVSSCIEHLRLPVPAKMKSLLDYLKLNNCITY